MAALPRGEGIEPMDGRTPCPRMVSDGSNDTYWDPRSERCTQPLGLFRLARAIFSASSASSAVMLGPIGQPAMRRGHMSIASARYSQPWRVLT